MSHLSKLKLSSTSPREPQTPLARKRLKLLRQIDLQLLAAQAEANDEAFMQEVTRWVRNEEGEKQKISEEKPVKRWWWQNQHGAWMISLRDGNRLIALDDKHQSVEVGEHANIVPVLEALRGAVVAGELDQQLEGLISIQKRSSSSKGSQAKR